ncbi:MAG: hypothetical protein JW874_06765 [Spirochaetales bacterium]|nr:hypothetical protein [Spirochaetales bacterium]
MKERIIEYDIIENQLGNGDAFRGIIHHELALNNAALVDEIVERNTTVSRQEALAVIDLYEQLIREHLHKGHTITTGLFRADISMSGRFASRSDQIDYKRHRARVVIRPAIKLNKLVCTGLRFHKRRQTRNNYFLSWVGEVDGSLQAGAIGAGSVIKLVGKGLKAYAYENRYELCLNGIDSADAQKHALRVLTATKAKITALVPNNVPPGKYELVLFHRYGSVNRELRMPGIEVVAEG